MSTRNPHLPVSDWQKWINDDIEFRFRRTPERDNMRTREETSGESANNQFRLSKDTKHLSYDEFISLVFESSAKLT